MRPSRDAWAMKLALVTAQRATCRRRQVGCVLLNARGHVLATGYNGVAASLSHCNESSDNRFVLPNKLMYTELEPALKLMYSKMPHIKPETVGEARIELYTDAPRRRCLKFKWYPHACPGAASPSGQNLDACQAIHAEQNALLQCHDVYAIHAAYVTTSPCVTCTKLLLNTSCERIIFMREYPHSEARQLWEGAGRIWDRLVVSNYFQE